MGESSFLNSSIPNFLTHKGALPRLRQDNLASRGSQFVKNWYLRYFINLPSIDELQESIISEYINYFRFWTSRSQTTI